MNAPFVTHSALEAMVVREFERLCPQDPTYFQAEQAVREAITAAMAEAHAMELLRVEYETRPCGCGNPLLCSRPRHEEES